jgi:hypothetical protein
MTDTFMQEPMPVPDEQMGLWDALPPEPDEFWDEPPDEDWTPPEPPELVDEPVATSESPVVNEPFAPPVDGAIQEPVYEPSNAWERFLASATPEVNPDILDSEQRSRAQALNLVDARFVGVEYQNEAGQPTGYGVGCVEVYADAAQENGVAGSYLEIAAFDNPLDAAALYDTLQTPVDKGWIAHYSVHELANFAAEEHDLADDWRAATPDDLAIYDWYAGHDLTFEPPREVEAEQSSAEPPNPAFNALSAIGIQAADFDPAQDPPPFYDPATSTAYWIGIFQPDLEDPSNCVASVLSLGRNPETGTLEAQLAPCVPGDWDKAFESTASICSVSWNEKVSTLVSWPPSRWLLLPTSATYGKPDVA